MCDLLPSPDRTSRLPINKHYLATGIWSAVLLGVSIIIVNYNMALYVGEAIKSALNQDHPLVEIIVVDDGSTDDSSDVISSYADRARVLLLEENIGQVSALCRAWPLARYPVVVFLDSDDLMRPHAAARLAATFAATTGRVQFCLQTIDDAGRPLDHYSPKYPSHLDTKTIRSELLRTGSSPAAQGSGNAYAKWMLEKVEQDNGFEMPAEKRMAMDAAMEVNAAFYGGSCPWAWCSSVAASVVAGVGRVGQVATAGSMTVGSSFKGAMVSRVM